MTKTQLLAKIDRLGLWAAQSLQRTALYEHDPSLAATFRANAACFNEAAGLLALDLGAADFKWSLSSWNPNLIPSRPLRPSVQSHSRRPA